jgi:hypothetical protein
MSDLYRNDFRFTQGWYRIGKATYLERRLWQHKTDSFKQEGPADSEEKQGCGAEPSPPYNGHLSLKRNDIFVEDKS